LRLGEGWERGEAKGFGAGLADPAREERVAGAGELRPEAVAGEGDRGAKRARGGDLGFGGPLKAQEGAPRVAAEDVDVDIGPSAPGALEGVDGSRLARPSRRSEGR